MWHVQDRIQTLSRPTESCLSQPVPVSGGRWLPRTNEIQNRVIESSEDHSCSDHFVELLTLMEAILSSAYHIWKTGELFPPRDAEL